MPKVRLSLESLHLFGVGDLTAAFNAELARVVSDLHDRPDLETKRGITMRLHFVPIARKCANSGVPTLEDVEVAFDCKSTVPQQAQSGHRLAAQSDRNGEVAIYFSTTNNDARQRTLADEVEELADGGNTE